MPDVNASAYMFEAKEDGSIRYGLGAVKGVGRGACEAIADERRANGPYADLLDFCKRVDSTKLNRRTLEALIHAGALDGLANTRASLMLQLPEVLKATDQITKNRNAGMVDMFGNAAGAPDIGGSARGRTTAPDAAPKVDRRQAHGGHPADDGRMAAMSVAAAPSIARSPS